MPEILLENLRRMKKGCGRTVTAPAQATSNARFTATDEASVAQPLGFNIHATSIRLTPLALSFLILASG
jgi:hypothetical protein